MARGGRMEFAMPKVRVALAEERPRVDIHVFWACTTLAALFMGYTWGLYTARSEPPPRPACRTSLNDGIVVPEGIGQCTYITPAPAPRKGKPS